MQKVGDITSTATPEGEFTDGNVAGGVNPTLLMALWFNTIQRELCNVVTESGGTLDPNDFTQIVKAIRKISGDELDGKGFLAASKNLSDLNSIPTSRDNLGLKSAALRDVADSVQGDLVPVGYKGNFKSDSNHSAIDFSTYPFVVGESLFIDTTKCTNRPSFLTQDFYYMEVICATGPAAGGRVNRPLIQFISYTNSKMSLAIREDDGTNIGWRYFQIVQYDSDNNTVTIPGALKAVNGGAELSQNAINIRGAGNKHLWFFNASGNEAGLVYASDDKVLHLRAGQGPSLDIQSNGNVIAGNYFEAKNDIHSGRNISSVGLIQAGAGLYDTPGVRVYSPNNMPPQQDLSPYAPISWVSGNFLQGSRKGAKGAANSNQSSDRFARAPDGASVVSVYNESNYIAIEYRYDQYNINGNWYNVGAI
ncbi:hypothetical protein [Enterobacter asburiae]|uniref:hypothetical protein n=1 Tax=Enterobacter asburiae TaxID=61645 RepID=UPI003C12BEAE